MADLIKDFHTTLTSTAALLITISTIISPFLPTKSDFPIHLIFYSSISYLVAIVTGIIAHGALTSAIYYGNDPFKSRWVKVPAILQWGSFVLGSTIVVYMLYILTLT